MKDLRGWPQRIFDEFVRIVYIGAIVGLLWLAGFVSRLVWIALKPSIREWAQRMGL